MCSPELCLFQLFKQLMVLHEVHDLGSPQGKNEVRIQVKYQQINLETMFFLLRYIFLNR